MRRLSGEILKRSGVEWREPDKHPLETKPIGVSQGRASQVRCDARQNSDQRFMESEPLSCPRSRRNTACH